MREKLQILILGDKLSKLYECMFCAEANLRWSCIQLAYQRVEHISYLFTLKDPHALLMEHVKKNAIFLMDTLVKESQDIFAYSFV